MIGLGQFRKYLKTVAIATTLVACAGMGSAELGVGDQIVLLGQSLPLSGASAEAAAQRRDGAALHFEALNAAGGVHGRRVEVLILDDGNDLQRALANTRKLLYEHRVFALFDYLGAGTRAAHQPIVEAERVPLLVSVLPGPNAPRRYQRYYFQFEQPQAFAPTSGDRSGVAAQRRNRISAMAGDYLAALAARRPTAHPNEAHFGGYVTARVLSEALAQSGRDLNREKLVAALERLEQTGIEGTRIAFSPSHQLGATSTVPVLLAASRPAH
ncbi:MAG: ABC transporter substrate-binding protein [Betaproteobacteria bacterium]|nr:ABC transporter substrate-binding protein [Betaproteobacteria bacterium]